MTNWLIVAMATAMAVTTAAAARDHDDSEDDKGNEMVCRHHHSTSSRQSTKVCMTREEWKRYDTQSNRPRSQRHRD